MNPLPAPAGTSADEHIRVLGAVRLHAASKRTTRKKYGSWATQSEETIFTIARKYREAGNRKKFLADYNRDPMRDTPELKCGTARRFVDQLTALWCAETTSEPR